MGRTVTGSFVVVYDTLAEYNVGVTNITNYESENGAVDNKVLDEANLTISYDITEVV